MALGMCCNNFRQGRLAATRRPPEDKRVETPVPYNSVKYPAGPEQVRLPDEFGKVARAHPLGQGRLPPYFITRPIFEYIQLVHRLFGFAGSTSCPSRPLQRRNRMFSPKIQLPKDKLNFKENVQIFQFFARKMLRFVIFPFPAPDGQR